MHKTVLTMTVEQWEDKYKPVMNHLDKDASWGTDDEGGVLYDYTGAEGDYVMKVASVQPHKVWTWVDGDDGSYIVDGYHWVNRIGYFITAIPSEFDEDITIKVDTYGEGAE
ncbi:hypothetical protein UFOVP1130_15 [uncultured Caudovirales phage]|uniref:Uncharacterized protein n=1 Tax=uncultured Caudovirales phage TaxID=2100421 RepID=A0A6J5QV45_9CAUD|nr:hypothetical protein UFOVP1130_15 [uncultured Caudovirales phage]